MSNMEQDAEKWKMLVDQKVIQKKYIAVQTGLTEREVNAFLELADDIDIDKNIDYDKIYETLKLFFDFELKIGNFKYIDSAVFSDILRSLQNEFHISANELEKRIRERIDTDYFEKQREKDEEVMDGFTSYQLKKYGGFDFLIDSPELLKAKRQKRKELLAELYRIDDFLAFGFISYSTGIDPETGEYIEEEYNFSPQEISDMKEQCSRLRTEIKQLEKEISELLQQDEQDWKEYCKLLEKNSPADLFNEELRKNKAKARTDRKKIASGDYVYNALQQKTILELFFDLCTDKNGYVLPEHFGSGINLARIIEEKTTWVGGWKNMHGIKKVSYWATNENIAEYGYNDTINIIAPDDPVYKLILDHQQVFFHDLVVGKVEPFMKTLRGKEKDVRNSLFDKLVDETVPIPRKTSEIKYCKILSEYYDILSLKTPVPNFKHYGREEIYRIVYEIASSSNGSIKFSNELVQNVYLRIYFKVYYWRLQMYLSQHYFHHKEFDSLFEFIEKESKEPEI